MIELTRHRCIPLCLFFCCSLTAIPLPAQTPSSFQDFIKQDAQNFQNWKHGTPPSSHPVTDRHSLREAQSRTVTYSGTADADGRSATLKLTFKDSQVDGHLVAKGVTSPNMRLPTTDIKFGPLGLTGPWEDANTTIVGPWTGGDYIDGKLVPNYPTNGTVRIWLQTDNNTKAVRLHRIANSTYGYTFKSLGAVYTAIGNNPNNPDTVESTGYHDPVGSWIGHWQQPDENIAIHIVYKMAFTKDGAASVKVSNAMTGQGFTLDGTWRRKGDGIEIQWSSSSLTAANISDNDPVQAGFAGPNKLNIKTEDGVIPFTREATTTSDVEGQPPLDISKISRITLSYTNTIMTIGTNQPAPRVFAVMRGSGKLVPIPASKVSWTGFKEIKVEDDKLIATKKVKDGDSGKIQAEVDIGGRPRYASCHVTIKRDYRTGTMQGQVWLGYFDIPRGPDRALGGDIELIGLCGSRYTTFGPDGSYRFENLEPGGYRTRVTRIDLPGSPPMPDGYVSSPTAVKDSLKRFSIPSGPKWHAQVAQWWQMVKKKTHDHCVYGKVLYKGKPVERATVKLINDDGSSIKEVESNEHGEYEIDTTGMLNGRHKLMVLKMVDTHNTPPWAVDDDLLDIASHSGNQESQSVVLPILAIGEEIDIYCDTRKQLLGNPNGPPTENNTPDNPQAP
jgi:hypothetical protein